MTPFKVSLLVCVISAVMCAVAIGKADQTGWPKIDGTDKAHFFQQKQIDPNGDAYKVGTDESDKLLGAHGNDTLIGMGGSDVIWGDEIPNGPTTQRDRLEGGPGNDFIYASRGRSVILGGPGNDFIKARDGRGTIDCGPGRDEVRLSRLRAKNWKLKNCEVKSYKLDNNQK